MKTIKFARKYLPLAIFIAVLGGCGGGGDGGGAQPTNAVASTPSFPVEATFTSLVSKSSTFNASATDAAGNSYALGITLTAGPDKVNTLIHPSSLRTYLQASILKKNGVTASTSSSEIYYSATPLLVWGNVNGSKNTMLVKKQTALPAMAKVGTAGAFYSGKNYKDNSTLFPDQQDVSWSLEADTATTAWLCLNTTITPALAVSASATSVEADCFRIDQNGSVSGFKSDFTQWGTTLKFR
ncbi:hypothetical protein [Caballeronia sp. GaOx3]|uniref:hypothetical protein n=1 Tax=Caballeronia sp. GaOx3 TaxID=2921740 RepID=UPI002028BAD8|nr:hypothetical protein [Caballeronia sp. GaOx3]